MRPAVAPRSWVLGEFPTPAAMLAAGTQLSRDGHRELDAHTPYPVHGVEEALALPRSRVPAIAAAGGALGIALAYGFQLYTAAVDYPLNVGNRPPHSPPAFVPITFELMVLLSALAIFFGLLLLWRMPRLHHPVFEVEEFRSASSHAFWLSVATSPERAGAVAERLREQGATHVSVVEEET